MQEGKWHKAVEMRGARIRSGFYCLPNTVTLIVSCDPYSPSVGGHIPATGGPPLIRKFPDHSPQPQAVAKVFTSHNHQTQCPDPQHSILGPHTDLGFLSQRQVLGVGGKSWAPGAHTPSSCAFCFFPLLPWGRCRHVSTVTPLYKQGPIGSKGLWFPQEHKASKCQSQAFRSILDSLVFWFWEPLFYVTSKCFIITVRIHWTVLLSLYLPTHGNYGDTLQLVYFGSLSLWEFGSQRPPRVRVLGGLRIF